MEASLTRRQRLLGDVDPAQQRGLEFGPLTNPVVAAQEGSISYVDYLPTEALRAKYREDQNVDASKIVDVDIVLENGRLPASVLTGGFDYIVASHVLEHLPDPIGWLKQCADALKQNGVLCLALPDKRYTWDILRRTTEIGEWVDGYVMRRVSPSPGQVFNATSRTVLMATGVPWEREPTSADLCFERDLSDALALATPAATTHIDVHCSVFTPADFLRLVGDTHRLGLCSFELGWFHDIRPMEIEFFVGLRKAPITDSERAAASFYDAAAALPIRVAKFSATLTRWRRRLRH